MNNFRFKIIIAIAFLSIFISAIIAIVNYIQLREQTIKENVLVFHRIEETIKGSIKTFEKAVQLLDNNTAVKMEEHTNFLLEKYKKNPNFDEWDFEDLYKQLGMHIYIINNENIITHSSFSKDVGLNFNNCCKKLALFLDERRKTGKFYHDDLDIEQQSGELKKYSYKATPDKKYLIELSYSLKQDEVFNAFNFFHTIDELKALYPYIYEIHIINIGGLTFGISSSERKLTKKEREAFETTLATKQTTEIQDDWKGKPATFRYIYYDSEFEGDTQNKVIEIIYDEKLWSANLTQYKEMFIIQLLIIISFVLVLSFMIARPMYLAYHDRLTGLANRSSFEELNSSIKTKKGTKAAFLMIDLDYFKNVNDLLGHHAGDELLKEVAAIIRSLLPKNGMAFRYGGDEFIVILESTTSKEAEKLARNIIEKINEFVEQHTEIYEIGVSASIGISYYPDDGDDKRLLYKKADAALYNAKKNGKGQYAVFRGES